MVLLVQPGVVVFSARDGVVHFSPFSARNVQELYIFRIFYGSSEFLLVKRGKCGKFTEAVEKKSMAV